MRNCDIVLIFDPLQTQMMGIVLVFCLQSRQYDPTAADDGFSGTLYHIPAQRAHVNAHAQHIVRSVGVYHIHAGKQFNNGYAQGGGKRFDQRNVRVSPSGLPLGDCLIADRDLLSQLVLRQPSSLSQALDHRSRHVLIHA